MKRLLDLKDNYFKNEKNMEEYLERLPDTELKRFYNTLEFTSFSSLLGKRISKEVR